MTDQPPVNVQAQTGGLDLPPAKPSPPEVLAREPNRYEDATEGPHPQVSSTTYVTWNKPDGDSFIAPLSQSEVFERKGYSRGEEQVISNLVTYLAGQEERVEESKQDTEDAIRRITGEPRSEEEAEEDRERLERERQANIEERRARTAEDVERTNEAAQQADHPHGGPPGQTGEHPVGGPPGQTGEHPQGGPPGQTGEAGRPPEATTLPTPPPAAEPREETR